MPRAHPAPSSRQGLQFPVRPRSPTNGRAPPQESPATRPDANWQIVHNSGSGAPTLINLGASFPVDAPTNVLTLFLYAAPNASSVWVRVVEEVSGAIAEVELTANLPAATQLLSPRNYMNTGSTATAVAYDCSGVYVETDY